jgi:hypothetical protein
MKYWKIKFQNAIKMVIQMITAKAKTQTDHEIKGKRIEEEK